MFSGVTFSFVVVFSLITPIDASPADGDCILVGELSMDVVVPPDVGVPLTVIVNIAEYGFPAVFT